MLPGGPNLSKSPCHPNSFTERILLRVTPMVKSLNGGFLEPLLAVLTHRRTRYYFLLIHDFIYFLPYFNVSVGAKFDMMNLAEQDTQRPRSSAYLQYRFCSLGSGYASQFDL